MHVWVKLPCSRKSIVKRLGAVKVGLMVQYFGKSYILKVLTLYYRSGAHIKHARSSELNSSCFVVHIRVLDGRSRGVVGFSDFRCLVQCLDPFRDGIWCFRCAARTAGAGRGVSILIPYDS